MMLKLKPTTTSKQVFAPGIRTVPVTVINSEGIHIIILSKLLASSKIPTYS